jgi:hypothetical protein
VSDRPLRVILDTSAILRYARGGDAAIHVGEIVSEIDDEGCAVGLPTLCMTAAWRAGGDSLHEALVLLFNHDASRVVAPSTDWRALAAIEDVVGRTDAAAAVLLAIDHGVALLSAEPDVYTGFDPYLVIEV